MPSKKLSVEALRQSIDHGGEFRVHLAYGRNGGCKARMWNPDGFVVGSASGGGYDVGGAALGNAIALLFAEEIKALPLPTREYSGPRTLDTTLLFAEEAVSQGLYGLSEHNGQRTLDGACGMNCMLQILEALGFSKVRNFSTGKHTSMILADR